MNTIKMFQASPFGNFLARTLTVSMAAIVLTACQQPEEMVEGDKAISRGNKAFMFAKESNKIRDGVGSFGDTTDTNKKRKGVQQ